MIEIYVYILIYSFLYKWMSLDTKQYVGHNSRPYGMFQADMMFFQTTAKLGRLFVVC